MEQLKHECGVAMIRLLKPLAYYKEKYGTNAYGLSKLYLMMEKQHNRGQEAAGLGVVKLHAMPGDEYIFRERAQGPGAIQEIFDTIRPRLEAMDVEHMAPAEAEAMCPYIGEIYMGHLRYSTTGRAGLGYVHPFLRRNNWRSRSLMLCGNFNLTNVDRIFESVVSRGQHPRLYSDTLLLLEQLGYSLDRENHRIYRFNRDILEGRELTRAVERDLNLHKILRENAPLWDGGFVICGTVGSGNMFVIRDPKGIRPAFYYADDEIVAVASERPVIQTVMNVARREVHELAPGSALTVTPDGGIEVADVLGNQGNARCSFERIYFSRGSDADIYRERKELGRLLVPEVLRAVGDDLEHAIFSYIPNTAEVAYFGMVEGLEAYLNARKEERILALQERDELTPGRLSEIMRHRLRIEKLAIKDIKLRTFIAEGEARNELAAHVYDVTYGCVENDRDTVVVIDDSIVRGTTLRESILAILDRLHPRKIVVASSSPQVRYPDYYGIDMSRMSEFIAFRAAVALLRESGREDVLEQTYRECLAMADVPDDELRNCVKAIYEPFSDREVADQMARMLKSPAVNAEVELVFQTVEGLHCAMPGYPGDWYFSGDYPTPGGIRLVNKAYVNWYEGHADRR